MCATEPGRPIEDLPPALENLEAILAERRGRELALFLDYDGTLSPIVDRPEAATLPDATREVLRDLARRRIVAVVSGRDLHDLRERVGLEDAWYAGSHGFHLSGPGRHDEEHAEARRFLPALDRAERQLERALGELDGVQVERKRYAIAVHFRRAPEAAVPHVRDAVQRARDANPELRIGTGRKVLELRPELEWDKGTALGWMLAALGRRPEDVFPVYLGDDVTDEDAFRAIEGRGVGVLVHGRSGRTRARFVLEDPDAVRRFLVALDERLDDA
jgi:alpha,alpha-trehalase